MYEFVDTIEASVSDVLPAEALSINGEYIENLIPGYRTLNVQGREALSPDVVSFTTGVRDGSRLKSKRYPERIITVTYQLAAESNEAFREAYNQLGAILDVEEAELIFSDETDKFFVGTPCTIDAVPPGKNAVVGKFEILCTDPFKYSVIEYDAEPDLDKSSILINYGGTYKSFPTLEAEFFNEDESDASLTGDGDCGYVAFFNENKKIIQLGDPNETDTESYAKSQTLVTQKFQEETAWGTIPQTNWATNTGKVSSDSFEQLGNMSMQVASYLVTTAPSTSATLLKTTSKAETPYFDYKVTAKTSGRTETSVKVEVTVTASLNKTTNYFGGKRGLKGSIKFGNGDWHSVTIKKEASAQWKSNSGHTTSITVTVDDLEADTTVLENIKFKVERTDSLGKAGILDETACSNLPISVYTAPVPDTWYLMPESYGSSSVWHGPSITRTIPADAAGDVGAANFTFTYKQKMAIGSGNTASQELGAFQALLISGSGTSRKIVAGVNVFKNKSGKKANLRFYVNGKTVKTMEIDLSHNNKYFGNNSASKNITTVKTSTITKVGKKVSFNIGGIKKTFTDSSIANTAVKEITFMIAQYGTKPALSYNGLYWAKFVKNNCDTWEDIPNKFSANDIVTADCKNGEVYLNDTPTPSLGALGNDWEDFYLTPGLNQIGFAYSDWVADDYAPTFRIRYREVFL